MRRSISMPDHRRSPTFLNVVILLAGAALLAGCSGGDRKPAPAAAITPTAATIATLGASPTAAATLAPTVPAAAVDAVPAPPIDWSACGAGFQCGSLTVPEDYAHPDAGSITLPLIRLPASGERIGSLVTNPGGPGASGVDFVRRAAKSFFTSDTRARFDIVGFDPRGVGDSNPAIDCTDDLDPIVEEDPSPNTKPDVERQTRLAQQLATGCEQRSGALLAHVSTDDVARDLDLLRRALGDEKLNYAGFSYGTLIGALYADMFPTRIRAMMLDGAVDPALSPVDDTRAQIVGFEHALDAFLADCSANTSCDFHSGGDAGAAFDALLAAIEQAPLPSDDGRDVGPGLAWLGVAAALYDRDSGWPALAQALASARDDGDDTLLASYADALTGRRPNGTYDNELEQRLAINCVDFPHLTPQQTADLLADLATAAPRFGKNSGLASADPCDYSPVPPQREPARVTAAGAPPIMVIGTTGDPATPYQQAVSLAGQLQSGALFTWNGEGHTAYGKGTPCVNDAADAYLIDLQPPAPGASC
jgi:pimeloyl-ACP methyl ester carboxylesterase